eukprot:CAMPEP_0170469962 /NCGR_PEP_ID=MMETSP0123-20130129/12598_1 /TAXON_ID=182087 /ORGANISM="Favella ehrenbergii, Strain Fehren 1" /LENGTH=119 /DNA_ID=CAMNT_0010736967 /DNA_START=789 /DNA_END=1148 /DNA_ORIENTATION=-
MVMSSSSQPSFSSGASSSRTSLQTLLSLSQTLSILPTSECFFIVSSHSSLSASHNSSFSVSMISGITGEDASTGVGSGVGCVSTGGSTGAGSGSDLLDPPQRRSSSSSSSSELSQLGGA